MVGKLEDEGKCGEERGGKGDCRGGDGNLGKEKTSCGASLARSEDSMDGILDSAKDSLVESFASVRASDECNLEKMAGSMGG